MYRIMFETKIVMRNADRRLFRLTEVYRADGHHLRTRVEPVK